MLALLREESVRGRCAVAVLVYAAATAMYFLCADPARIVDHTPFNHFALLAEAWLDGRLHLAASPPSYAGYNDFAKFEGHWYVTFPGFPAVLLVPFVLVGGGAEQVRDGQVFLWLAGVAPAVLFLALEKMRALGLSQRCRRDDALLALLFALGSAYCFSAVQGTVWYAAHVVGTGLAAVYLWCSLGAQRPLLAGLALGLAFHTRAPMLFGVGLFVVETLRTSSGGVPSDTHGLDKVRHFWRSLDRRRFLTRCAWFSLPVVVCLVISFAHNAARFGDPMEVGYRFLQVHWQPRMQKWGLFSYHYFPRNLAVVLTSLPWYPVDGAPFRISAHGLALWFTTPLYLWLVWPRTTGWLHWGLWLTVAGVGLPSLFYQNSGWVQFAYRFSNDYAVFLFALLALGRRRLGPLFHVAAAWSVAWNVFGAVSFERKAFRHMYHLERTQQVLHQPDTAE